MANITKISLQGVEYNLTDKEAQKVIESLTKRIEELENYPYQLYLIEVE